MVQHNAAVGASGAGEPGKTRISVTLDADALATLQTMADERDRSLSWFAGHAIRFYLAEMRKGSQLALAFEDPDHR